MPELPEVEAARRAIEEHCVGKTIVLSTIADDAKVIDGVARSDFESSIAGKTIVAAHRKGKNMWIQLDSPPFPSFQFGMAGAIYINGIAVTKYKRSAVKDTDEWPSKYSKVFVELDDGLEFSFTDKRRFAKVRLLDDPASMPPISELGPDALLQPMTLDEFQNSLSKKKIGIKALLLDQSFISGIGNWMADEVLYQAKIHPMQIASSVSKESCATLLQCINEITRVAVEVDADSLRFPDAWLFHLRWGKKPGNLNGMKIEFINAGGRTTAYVPELQKLTGNQAIKGEVDESKVEKTSKKVKVLKGNNKKNKLSKAKKSRANDSDSSSDDDDEDDHSDSDEIIQKKTKQQSINKAKEANKEDDNEVHKRQSRRTTKRKEEKSEDERSDDEDSSKARITDGKRRKAGATVQKGKRKGRAK